MNDITDEEAEVELFRETDDKRFHRDAADFAFTARVDVRLAGDWGQSKDFAAWAGEEMAAFIGAAIHYEIGETGDGFLNNNFFMWTVDGSVEMNNFNAFAYIVGYHSDLDDILGGVDDVDFFGYVFQLGYMVIPDTLEPFFRFEYFDFADFAEVLGLSDSRARVITFGTNYYLNRHNAKVVVDLVWAVDSLGATGGLTGGWGC